MYKPFGVKKQHISHPQQNWTSYIHLGSNPKSPPAPIGHHIAPRYPGVPRERGRVG